MSAEQIATALAQHRVESVTSHPTRTTWSWRYECSCGSWAGEPFVMGEAMDAASLAAAEMHQAGAVVEALAHGAPAVAGEVTR